MTDASADFDAVIRGLAMADLRFEAEVTAGLHAPAEVKAYEARRAETIARLDELRGTSDVTYAEFRAAFEAAAGCRLLIELKNGMHPKDPLKIAANEDLRSVQCHSRTSTRQDLSS